MKERKCATCSVLPRASFSSLVMRATELLRINCRDHFIVSMLRWMSTTKRSWSSMATVSGLQNSLTLCRCGVLVARTSAMCCMVVLTMLLICSSDDLEVSTVRWLRCCLISATWSASAPSNCALRSCFNGSVHLAWSSLHFLILTDAIIAA